MDLNTLKREDVKVVDDELSEILAQTIADYETRSGKVLQPAHIERLIINTYAYREALVRQQINEAYRQQHPRFATGLMLDLCGDDVNTPRLSAQPALTTLRFRAEISDHTVIGIPEGTVVRVGELGFATRTAGSLSAERRMVELPAQCTVAGTVGNGWAVGQINTLDAPLHPTIRVDAANTTQPAGGVDIESDDAYRERILLAPESFSVAGPIGAYQYWARQVSPAIVDVHVAIDTDTADRPIGGVVAVTLLTQDGVPGAELIREVQTALSDEKRRPLCDTVVVRAPRVKDYRVEASLTLYAGEETVAVLAAARAAFAQWEQARKNRLGRDIVPLEIAACLKVSGVYNVTLSAPLLTRIRADEWARCTELNLTVDGETDG